MKTSRPVKHVDVPCPFCGLICDDLVISNNQGQLATVKNACQKATQAFERPLIEDSPRINGARTSLKAAVKQAAAILKNARQPLFSGLATDVAGMRAVMAIAKQTGGVVDHIDSKIIARNLRALQDQGWINTTLTEVRNRADLILLAGTDTIAFPRFFERVIDQPSSMFGPNAKQVIYLGDSPKKLPGLNQGKVNKIKCAGNRIEALLMAIRALVKGYALQAKKIAGVDIKEVQKLLEKIQSASYGVIVWSAADFNWPHADLTVKCICGLIADLNQTGHRFAGLPLGGSGAGNTAASVCTWQSGYCLSSSFGGDHPTHDSLRFSAVNMLTDNEADVLVWVSGINSGWQPPSTKASMIALTEPGMKYRIPPAVQIPIGTPGLDHAGHMIRCDSVVSLRLHKLRDIDLPDAAAVLEAIRQAL